MRVLVRVSKAHKLPPSACLNGVDYPLTTTNPLTTKDKQNFERGGEEIRPSPFQIRMGCRCRPPFRQPGRYHPLTDHPWNRGGTSSQHQPA